MVAASCRWLDRRQRMHRRLTRQYVADVSRFCEDVAVERTDRIVSAVCEWRRLLRIVLTDAVNAKTGHFLCVDYSRFASTVVVVVVGRRRRQKTLEISHEVER